ncbi:MAG TPA: beta-propeller fold lactonase family protein [Chloroflexia bacterium]|nr:beta-propeller fold lactonase family protein [Chloroflexia bacterium]
MKRPLLILTLVLLPLLAACGEESGEPASKSAVRDFPAPQGRILTANQAANTISLIDVATDTTIGTVGTGAQPHHVVGTPDGKEFWVTLYGENRVQVFDAQTLKEIASVDLGASNDDLTFDPAGQRLYVSLGKNDEIAVVDVPARKLIQTVKVGKIPHGVKVTPDGKHLLVTNTADNTLSILTTQPELTPKSIVKTGANPFEVTVSDDSATAYVSNFLGDSIALVDLASEKVTGYIRSGKQPAMLAVQPNAPQNIWVANTASAEVWVLDASTRKLVTRIPVGKGAHGVVMSANGKIYVTNSTDNTLSVIDQAQTKVIATIPVGNNPNGLSFLPNPSGQQENMKLHQIGRPSASDVM